MGVQFAGGHQDGQVINVITGTGGGATPNLQQVTTIGEITTNQLVVNPDPGNIKKIITNGAVAIDPRYAALNSNDTEDSGLVEIGHKDGTVITLHNDLGGNNTRARFRGTIGGIEEVAYLTDIPAVNSFAYTPTVVSSSNITSIALKDAHYSIIGNQITVTFSYAITPTIGSTATSLTLSLPVLRGTAAADAMGVGVVSQSNILFATVIATDATGGADVIIKFLSFAVPNPTQLFVTCQYLA